MCIYTFIAFYRATACNATHSIAVAIPSVRLSVSCVYCDKTKWCTADILIPHETAITLVFWHQHWLVGDASFPVKCLPKVPTSFVEHRLWDICWCSIQGSLAHTYFKLLCRPGQSVLDFVACLIATASLVPDWPCTEPLAVPTTAQWTAHPMLHGFSAIAELLVNSLYCWKAKYATLIDTTREVKDSFWKSYLRHIDSM